MTKKLSEMAKLQKFLQKRGQDVCLMYFFSHILTTFGAKSLFLCSTVILSYIFKMFEKGPKKSHLKTKVKVSFVCRTLCDTVRYKEMRHFP